jgi:hypothetical protein
MGTGRAIKVRAPTFRPDTVGAGSSPFSNEGLDRTRPDLNAYLPDPALVNEDRGDDARSRRSMRDERRLRLAMASPRDDPVGGSARTD